VAEARGLAARAAFPLQASITVSFLAGSSLPTALYPLYQAAWGFSPLTITAIFAAYAFAVLCALLVAGRLADHLGRRPVLLVATVAQAAAMAVYGGATGVSALLAARIIQGLATGASVGAVGAALLDLHRERGARANALTPIMGIALGALGGGLMVHFFPAPLRLPYVVLGLVYAFQCWGLLFLPESVARRPGALASLRPSIHVSPAARPALAFAVPVLVAVWAIFGFYASLGPALVSRLFGFDASLFGGAALFVLSASGAVALRKLPGTSTLGLLRIGAAGVCAGAITVLAALASHAASLYLLGTIVTGIGFGTGFQGALRSILAPVPAAERAAVLSVVYIVCYVSMGLPSVLAGCAIAAGYPLQGVADAFAAVVLALAAFGLAKARA
jgi:MFS family permease